MAQYVRLTMPKAEAEALRLELRMIREHDLQMTAGQRAKLVQRLDAAIGGKDLRVTNTHSPRSRPCLKYDIAQAYADVAYLLAEAERCHLEAAAYEQADAVAALEEVAHRLRAPCTLDDARAAFSLAAQRLNEIKKQRVLCARAEGGRT